MAIKFAKYYELTRDDVVVTVFTDSAEMYRSRLEEARKQHGEYTKQKAIQGYSQHLAAMKTDSMLELTYPDRKRIHNLKYYTWIEQQMFNVDELNRQWYDSERYWGTIQKMTPKIDELITQFNQRVHLL
jgi:stalled ribosome alternative rescue factor ArfA